MSVPRIVAGSPAEVIVYDEPTECPYISGRVARMPMRLPTRGLGRREFNQRLQAGDRRQGLFLYRTNCPSCSACIPIRLNVRDFSANKTQRRILRRGDQVFSVDTGPPTSDAARVWLYNRHKRLRGLESGPPSDEEDYREFLVHTCCETFELRYRHEGELVGVAVVDRSSDGLSAVYFYFDPSYSKYSPGVYSIMKQLELCQRWGLGYLYLGLYIAECDAMRYKASYLPHEQLIDGEWRLNRR